MLPPTRSAHRAALQPRACLPLSWIASQHLLTERRPSDRLRYQPNGFLADFGLFTADVRGRMSVGLTLRLAVVPALYGWRSRPKTP